MSLLHFAPLCVLVTFSDCLKSGFKRGTFEGQSKVERYSTSTSHIIFGTILRTAVRAFFHIPPAAEADQSRHQAPLPEILWCVYGLRDIATLAQSCTPPRPPIGLLPVPRLSVLCPVCGHARLARLAAISATDYPSERECHTTATREGWQRDYADGAGCVRAIRRTRLARLPRRVLPSTKWSKRKTAGICQRAPRADGMPRRLSS